MESKIRKRLLFAICTFACMIQVGYSISCEVQNIYYNGTKSRLATNACPSGKFDKCFVAISDVTGSTRGCVPNLNCSESVRIIHSVFQSSEFTLKVCVCETDMCNNETFLRKCNKTQQHGSNGHQENGSNKIQQLASVLFISFVLAITNGIFAL